MNILEIIVIGFSLIVLAILIAVLFEKLCQLWDLLFDNFNERDDLKNKRMWKKYGKITKRSSSL